MLENGSQDQHVTELSVFLRACSLSHWQNGSEGRATNTESLATRDKHQSGAPSPCPTHSCSPSSLSLPSTKPSRHPQHQQNHQHHHLNLITSSKNPIPYRTHPNPATMTKVPLKSHQQGPSTPPRPNFFHTIRSALSSEHGHPSTEPLLPQRAPPQPVSNLVPTLLPPSIPNVAHTISPTPIPPQYEITNPTNLPQTTQLLPPRKYAIGDHVYNVTVRVAGRYSPTHEGRWVVEVCWSRGQRCWMYRLRDEDVERGDLGWVRESDLRGIC